jgi:murein DD-endopeptidase / murein LD-carboxypeptidase
MRTVLILISIFVLYFTTCAQELIDTNTTVAVTENVSSDSILGMPSDIYHYYTSKGILIDSTTNLKLHLAIYTWIGVRYRYGGKGPQGIDCSGFVKRMFLDVFESILVGGGSGDIYAKDVVPVSKDSLQEGDLLFFKIRRGMISHVGLYLSNNKFVHATTQAGVIISDLNEPYYLRYYFAAGRVQGLKIPN